MVTVRSVQRSISGKLYLNEFTDTDDLTKINESGTPTWALTGGFMKETAVGVGSAVKSMGQAAYYVTSAVKTDAAGNIQHDIAARVQSSNNEYLWRMVQAGNVFRLFVKAGTETQRGTDAAFTFTPGNLYQVGLLVSGTTITAIATDGVQVAFKSVTDSTFSTGGSAGLHTPGNPPSYWDFLAVHASTIITVIGLFEGQRVRFYSGGIAGPISAQASPTGIVTVDVTPTSSTKCVPPYDRMEVTDTDGTSVTYTYNLMHGIFGGDTYQVQVTSTRIVNPPPINPLHDGLSRIMVMTSKRLYTRILGHDLSLPAAGSLGTFRIFIEDETGREKDNIAKGEVCWIFGDLGFEHDIQMVGIIDTPTVHQFPGGVQALELAGRSYGSLAAKHAFSSRVDHQFQNPYYIMTNPTNGVATLVPEMEIGPYVFSPPNNLTYVTYLPGRDGYDVSQELADMSSKPEQRWNAFDCDGQDQGETKPNLHFEPTSKGISLLPVLFGKGFRVQAPEDSRQILTKAIVHFADSVAYDATDLVTIDSCFKLKLNITSPADYSLYVDLTNVTDYVIQAGDYLEYDVYYTHPQVLGGVDLYNSTAAKYLSSIGALDQWGLDAGEKDLGIAARRLGGSGRWWHRKIPMPASWVGGSITKFLPYADPKSPRAAKTVTVNGDAKIDTVIGGGFFDGVGDYLSLVDADWPSGIGDFTVEGGVRFNTISANHAFFAQFVDGTHFIEIWISNANVLRVNYNNGAGLVTVISRSATVSINTWYHIAFVRSGNNWYIFQDGTQLGATQVATVSLPDLAASAVIGTDGGGSDYHNGWLKNFRVSKVARYTSNFTPPTGPLVPDEFDVLLLPMATDFLDTPPQLTTVAGNVSIAFRNIKITDGQAAVRKVIFDGETSALTTATDSSANATFTSIVGGDDPRFGIISQLFERVWMTQSQAKDFGKLACSQLGDPVTFIQGDVPPDGRWKQGQLVEVWDEEPVGKARLTGVRHREMGGIGQTHLTLLLEEEAT